MTFAIVVTILVSLAVPILTLISNQRVNAKYEAEHPREPWPEKNLVGHRLRAPLSEIEADLLPPRTPADWIREAEAKAVREWSAA